MSKFLVYFIVLAHSVVVSYLLIDYKYSLPLLAIQYTSPLFLIPQGVTRRDKPLIILALLILLTAALHPVSFRISTVLYSMMFIMTYMLYTRKLPKSNISIIDFSKLLKGIIIAYAIVLFVQDFCTLIGIPVLNFAYEDGREVGYKLNALSYEPSHTGPIVTILFYVYIKLKEIIDGKQISLRYIVQKERFLLLCYLFLIVFSLSVTCILSLFVLLLYFVNRKHIIRGVIAIAIIIAIFFSMGTELGDRITALIPALLRMDASLLYEIDSSSTARIGPLLVFLSEMNFLSLDFWLGHGCDYGAMHLTNIITGLYDVEETMAGVKGVVCFIYDYGMLTFISFMYLVYELCRFKSFEFLIYITLFFVSGFNVYMTWLFFIMIYSLKYYQNLNARENASRDLNYNSHL